MQCAESFCTTEETQKLHSDTPESDNDHIKAFLMFDKHDHCNPFSANIATRCTCFSQFRPFCVFLFQEKE